MSRLSQVASLDGLTAADFAVGTASRAGAVALLTRAVELSRPGQAVALFKVLGKLSTGAYLTGVLELRIQPDADWSMIDAFVDTGSEVARLAPTLLSAVPFSEVLRVVDSVAPLALAGAATPRRVRLRGPEPVVEAAPESDYLSAALVYPNPPAPRKKSIAPRPKSVAPKAKSVAPPAPPAPPPRAASAPLHAPRRPAPSDVKATVRADAASVPVVPRRPSSAPRAPRPDVKATIKVETVHIPKEAIGGQKAVAPPRELLRKVDRTSALIPRDEDED